MVTRILLVLVISAVVIVVVLTTSGSTQTTSFGYCMSHPGNSPVYVSNVSTLARSVRTPMTFNMNSTNTCAAASSLEAIAVSGSLARHRVSALLKRKPQSAITKTSFASRTNK